METGNGDCDGETSKFRARFQLGLLSPSPFPSDGDGNGCGWRLDRDGDVDRNAKWRQEIGMDMERNDGEEL